MRDGRRGELSEQRSKH